MRFQGFAYARTPRVLHFSAFIKKINLAELFIVDEVTPTSIEINGYVPHLNSVDKWCLVVHEDEDGLADDQYPQFIPRGLANVSI